MSTYVQMKPPTVGCFTYGKGTCIYRISSTRLLLQKNNNLCVKVGFLDLWDVFIICKFYFICNISPYMEKKKYIKYQGIKI